MKTISYLIALVRKPSPMAVFSIVFGLHMMLFGVITFIPDVITQPLLPDFLVLGFFLSFIFAGAYLLFARDKIIAMVPKNQSYIRLSESKFLLAGIIVFVGGLIFTCRAIFIMIERYFP